MRSLSQADPAAVDRQLDDQVLRRTLDPARERATPLVELCERYAGTLGEGAAFEAFESGLSELAIAQLIHFPENLFWDFDFIAHDAVRQAAQATDPSEHLHELFWRMADLQRLYGRTTAIRFRYVHDFIYGFDWAKWVRREADQTGEVGPFDLPFLQYMARRADELLVLIAQDDQRYPRLREAGPRNPFPFSREVADEITLHEALARQEKIPVPGWRAPGPGEVLVWDRDYAAVRCAEAERLGLSHPT